MYRDLVEASKNFLNILEGRGEHIVIPDAVYVTHSTLPGDEDHLGIWWYNIHSGQLLYSRTADAHISKEFREAIPEITSDGRKDRAEMVGWVSGRIGRYRSNDSLPKVFAFLYTQNVSMNHLPGNVASDLLHKLKSKSGEDIQYLTDERGYDLIEKKIK